MICRLTYSNCGIEIVTIYNKHSFIMWHGGTRYPSSYGFSNEYVAKIGVRGCAPSHLMAGLCIEDLFIRSNAFGHR